MQERDRITFITTSFRDVWASFLPGNVGQFFHAVGKEKRGERGEKKGEREKPTIFWVI